MTIALENIDMAMIYLTDEDRKEAILQAYRNVPDDYIRRARRIPYPKGITWKVINSGEIINIEDAQKDPDIGPAGRDLGHHSILGIPITLEGKVIGVVWFISYKERQFNGREIDLLSSVGNQIAMAIAKAKLYRELSKKNRYETIISTVTRSVHQSINLQDVLENAVDAMSRNIDGANNVSIYMVEGQEAIIKAYRGYPKWFIERVRRIPYPKGFTWKTIIDGKPRYCADVDEDTFIGPAGREVGTMSYLSMPIRYGDNTVGAININSLQRNAFNEEELRLLEIVAQQIEVAINNAQIAEHLRLKGVIVGNMAEGVCLVKVSDGVIVYVNPKFEGMFGYGPGELNDKSAKVLCPSGDNSSEETLCKKIIECVNQYGMWTGEIRNIKKDGTTFWSQASVSTFEHPQYGRVWVGIHTDITERKKMEEELKNSHEQLRKLAAYMQSVREEERTRIAREIHDELGQALTGLKMSLSWLDKKLSEPDNNAVPRSYLLEEIASISKLIDTTAKRVQEISTELRPVVLDELGLTAAIEWQAQEFQTRMGIRCSFTSSPENIALDQAQSTTIFRILQEALTNVARHANASRVDISLKKKADNLILEVRDNGKGITESEISNPKSLGLLGTQERALLLGGEVKISGTPGRGTTVSVRIPLRG